MKGVTLEPNDDAEAVTFTYRGDLGALQRLKIPVAVYLRQAFGVPRPKGLLGDQHLRVLLASIRTVLSYEPTQTFRGFRFSAAGQESRVFTRLAAAIQDATGLAHDPDEGELLLRVRPVDGGWEVLARLTPRPLSARAWRVCNMSGGLNATLAVAMLELAGVHPEDRLLNPMCGSGTLLIEQALVAGARRLTGCDISSDALSCARQNLQAARLSARIELFQADATRLELLEDLFDAIVADLPWGDAVGTHAGNAALYPAFLQEMARLGTPKARLVVLTHEIKLFERVLAQQSFWKAQQVVRVFHGGHYPRMYLLLRAA
jgi:tRNA (guanine6-N2)-methyltransferase